MRSDIDKMLTDENARCAFFSHLMRTVRSVSAPAGMECCTSKLANPCACLVINVPPASTIFFYVLEILTLYGNPTTLFIGNETLTPGAAPTTLSGHSLTVPTTVTGRGLVDNGTPTSLGNPISTIIGTVLEG